MNPIRWVMLRLRRLVRRRALERDMHEEMREHLARATERYVARGMPPAEARLAARREFGNAGVLQEEARDVRGARWLGDLAADVRFAFRYFARHKATTAVAVLTLAIGIGGITAIFSAVDALLWRRLPYAAPEDLMTVSLTMPAIGGLRARDDMVWSYAKYDVFRDAQSIFSDLSLYMPQRFSMTSGDVELAQGELVGGRYLRTLGLAPVQGRDFDPGIDAHAGAERQAIVSYALWQRRYGGDPGIVGRVLDLDGNPYTVVGIAPRGFHGLTGKAELFVPITTRPAEELGEDEAQNHEFYMVARRKPGINAAAATSAVKLLGVRVRDAFPDPQIASDLWGATARPLTDIRTSPLVRRSLYVALAAVGFVLLIACANVANLLLGRASTRGREIAVRVAVGATRPRLVRLLLTESMLLALLGGLAGSATAWAGTRALRAVDPDTLFARGNDTLNGLGAVTFARVHLDGTALAFSVSITVIVGVLFGLAPALHATANSSRGARKLAAGEGTVRERGASGRRLLVVVELALAMIVLSGSGLLMRSFDRLMAIDPGFDAGHVLTLRLTIPPGAVPEASMPAFYDGAFTRHHRDLRGAGARGRCADARDRHSHGVWSR